MRSHRISSSEFNTFAQISFREVKRNFMWPNSDFSFSSMTKKNKIKWNCLTVFLHRMIEINSNVKSIFLFIGSGIVICPAKKKNASQEKCSNGWRWVDVAKSKRKKSGPWSETHKCLKKKLNCLPICFVFLLFHYAFSMFPHLRMKTISSFCESKVKIFKWYTFCFCEDPKNRSSSTVV